MKSLIIAAPGSGSGKTTVTLGLMECLKRRGLRVAPFKVGPDFIDPGYHRLVTGRPSINLDGWMCGSRFVQESFGLHADDADIAVIEGVMGLFDGIGGSQDGGSTAEVARVTGVPVVLVVDAKGQSRSVAALVKGFAEFDPAVHIVGVIFNNVASDNHGRLLREAVESSSPGVRVIGCLPRDERLHIPSRHLGLMTVDENPLPMEFLDLLVETFRERLDLGLLWGIATPRPGEQQDLPFGERNEITDAAPSRVECAKPGDGTLPVRIALARDEAFCFVYEDNLRLLREAGAEIVTFSPLRDSGIPDRIDGIYLPGGYPEIFADTLAENGGMRAAVRQAIESGMPAYAECGGFIYLTEGVADSLNEPESLHELAGVFPVTTRMLPRRKALGYREVELTADSILGPVGTVARGHEFHYSEMGEMPLHLERVYRVNRLGHDLGMEGFRVKNCLASYIHLHFASNPHLATNFVASCRKYGNQSPQSTQRAPRKD